MRSSTVIFLVSLSVICGSLISGACYKPIANTSDTGSSGSEVSYSEAEDGATPSTDPTVDRQQQSEEEKLKESNGPAAGGFKANFDANLRRNGLDPSTVLDSGNQVESRILAEYGAVFLTRAVPPPKVMFTSEAEVSAFQSTAGFVSANIGGVTIELQRAAMDALKKAVSEAGAKGLSITPRDGAEAARRDYSKTLDLWNSRFLKGLDHWKAKGRLTGDQAARLRTLPIKRQVSEVLDLEKSGIYFNTFFNNSILYSVAAPGTSQHLSMLALDVSEYANPGLRKVLAENGWFRTVQNDEPHFTYLGLKESELGSYGLKRVERNGGEYWVPEM